MTGAGATGAACIPLLLAGVAWRERMALVGRMSSRFRAQIPLHHSSRQYGDSGWGPAPSMSYVQAVSHRARVRAYGSAAALVVAGVICGFLIGGSTGVIVGSAMATLGLGA